MIAFMRGMRMPPSTTWILVSLRMVSNRAGNLPAPTEADQPPPVDPGLIPPTAVEVKKLFNLAIRVWLSNDQARARWYHHRARIT